MENAQAVHEIEDSGREPYEEDSAVTQYFSDVRQHTLLTPEQERVLWDMVDVLKRTERRALHMSPVGLSVLTQLSRQVEQGELPFNEVVRQQEVLNEGRDIEWLNSRVALLRKLATKRSHIRKKRLSFSGTRIARQNLRGETIALGKEWLALWSDLDLTFSVHDTIAETLAASHMANPEDPALRASYARLVHTRQKLERVKYQMLTANLRLVIYAAKNRRNQTELPFLDLIQEGNVGLMRAFDRFDPNRHIKFITYAYWWIRQGMTRGIAEQEKLVRIPSHVIDQKSKIRSTMGRLSSKRHGRTPDTAELSAALGWSPEKIEQLNLVGQPVVSLDESTGPDTDNLFGEHLGDNRLLSLDDYVAERELSENLSSCLAVALTERERRIIGLRFGFNGEPQSLKEIGELFGLSKERVRQIEAQALEKLRDPQFADSLREHRGTS